MVMGVITQHNDIENFTNSKIFIIERTNYNKYWQ